MNNNITEKDILKLIRGLVSFPFGQICIHSVALDLLNLMEVKKMNIPNGLIKAVSKCSEGDEMALKILNKVLKT